MNEHDTAHHSPTEHESDAAAGVTHPEHGGHPAVAAEHEAGHGKHAGHSPEMFRDRLLVSLLLTGPILYFSSQIQDWFGYEAASFAGSTWITPVLATVLFVYAGSVFLQGGRRELGDRLPGMMTLISMAITVAYVYSLAVTLGLDGDPFYWELATLLDVMLLGHWIEMRSIQSASKALDHLAAMVPSTAHRVAADGTIEEVAVAALATGDTIIIRPGEQVPADGLVADGASSMNEAFLTGESRPVAKGIGDEAIAGAVNGEGALTLTLTRIGEATTLQQIMRLVEEAQQSRSRFQALADRAAYWLTMIAIGVSLPTFVVWAVVGTSGITFAVARAVTVLVIACPHALGLAIPLVNMNATSVSARNGILVRNREAFERGRNIKYVAFDKTGTLTEGRFVVSEVTTESGSPDELLAMAAALERYSEHPLATAIIGAAADRRLDTPAANDVKAVPGQGVEGSVAGRRVRVGRPEWAAAGGIVTGDIMMGDQAAVALDAADQRGESAVIVMDESRVLGVVTMRDKVRDSAAATMARLRDLEVTPVMITGDAAAVAATVAAELGIERVYSRVLPQEKSRLVEELKQDGPTAFVGDGINDAAALLAADLGIAIGAGTNVAIESADLVLVDDDPADIARALVLSRATHRKMIQNLVWATGYNTIALPLAAGVAVWAGILLNPAIGALLMSMSTVIVAANAMLLRRIDLAAT